MARRSLAEKLLTAKPTNGTATAHVLQTAAEPVRHFQADEPIPPDAGDAYEHPADRLNLEETSDSTAEREVSSRAYRPFPVQFLPGPVQAFTVEAAAALGCDVGYVAPHVLTVLGGLLGNKVRIALKRSWREAPVIWTVVIGESGTLKSPAWQAVVSIVYRLQEALFKKYAVEREQYERDLEEWKKADEDERGDKPRPPRKRRLIVADTTVEKLAVILEENPAGVLLARDELSAVLSGFNQYKARGGSDVANYLEMHRAGPILVDRKGPGGEGFTFYIPRAALSITGTIQPAVFAKLMNEQFRASGLMARLLLTMPPRKVKRWTEADVDDSTIAAFSDLLQFLESMPTPLDPVAIPLSPASKALWVHFHDSWSDDNSAAVGDMAAAFSKLEGYAARIALIHHVVLTARDAAPTPIGEDSMLAGIALARWFGQEAERVYAVMEQTKGEAEAADLLQFIRGKGGRATPFEVYQSDRRKYPTCEAAEIALHKLDRLGRWATGESGPKGGRPPVWFILKS